MTDSRQATLRIALTADPELAVPPARYGGIERIVDMLARGLSKRGHDVTLFARGDSMCPVTKFAWPGRDSTRLVDTIRNSATLSRHVLAGRYDIVHSFSRIAYLLPILPFPVPKLMSFQRAVSPWSTATALHLSRGTLEFSAISRQMVEGAALAGRWHHVPNGVPLDVYDFQAFTKPDAPLVFLGRIEEIKGPHLAIEIARRAGRKLIIAGNIPDQHRSWFEDNIAPHLDGQRVRYVGPIDDREKNILLGAAAALLMPILWEEPFGIVMAEAMACGTPVLGLRRGAVPEVVEHAVTGFVANTVDELVIFVDRLGELDRAAARARVERLYSDESVTEGYLQIYGNLTNPRLLLRQGPSDKTVSER